MSNLSYLSSANSDVAKSTRRGQECSDTSTVRGEMNGTSDGEKMQRVVYSTPNQKVGCWVATRHIFSGKFKTEPLAYILLLFRNIVYNHKLIEIIRLYYAVHYYRPTLKKQTLDLGSIKSKMGILQYRFIFG